eukprot:38078-Lingulodinium_polyedra.AAC.1
MVFMYMRLQASLNDRESRTACAKSETVMGSTGILLSPPKAVDAPMWANRLSATRTHPWPRSLRPSVM